MLKVIGWGMYAFVGFIGTGMAFETGPWFGLVVALLVIFGPKVWKSL